MTKNNSVVPQALGHFKMETPTDVGVQSPLEENIQHIVNYMKT